VQHREEKLSKCTSVHAKILAPASTVFVLGDDPVPDLDSDSTLVLFPGPEAKTLVELAQVPGLLDRVERLVVVECTWVKAKAAVERARVKELGLVQVRLEEYQTQYWRQQRKHAPRDESKLSSIEAIYYFYVEWITLRNGKYSGEVDALLFLFNAARQMYIGNKRSREQMEFIKE
jgi:DTW domain-containing protein YfiP